MSNNEMILAALGFSNWDSQLDEFKTNFGYDWTDEDLDEAIEVAGYNTSNVRNCLMEILWLKVVYYLLTQWIAAEKCSTAISTDRLIPIFITTGQKSSLKRNFGNL